MSTPEGASPPLPSVVDVVVVGSGVGALSTAIAAKRMALDVLVLEKDRWFGGASARSGAALWLPGSRQAKVAGLPDDREAALRYLDALIGADAPREIRVAFLRHAPEALAFFEQNSCLAVDLRPVSPDYHPELPDASERGRVLDTRSFDGKRLGARLKDLRPPIEAHLLLGGMAVNRADVQALLKVHRSWPAFLHGLRLVGRYVRDRILHGRDTRLVLGNALVARLATTVFEAGVRLETSCPAVALTWGGSGEVTGVVAAPRGGPRREVRARHAVVLATGGFSADAELSRANGATTTGLHLSMLPESCSGDGIRFGQAAEGALPRGRHAFFFAPVSVHTRRDGSTRHFPHLTTDRAKPGMIAVDGAGRRFTNEADSYHRFGEALHRLPGREGQPAAWLVCDSRALRRYGLGIAKPVPAHWRNRQLVADGYLIEAATLDDLADRIRVPRDALAATISAQNRAAETGVDLAYGKGASTHNRALGDPEIRPNPCLAAVRSPPFYAVALERGDLGTALGLATDAAARVLRADGRPVPNLYAVGNDMNSLAGGHYPGGGITLGPALVFGYLAACDIVRRAGHHTSGREGRARPSAAT